jgi:hypothetical protein
VTCIFTSSDFDSVVARDGRGRDGMGGKGRVGGGPGHFGIGITTT